MLIHFVDWFMMSIYPLVFIDLSIYLSICPSKQIHPFVGLLIWLSIQRFIHLLMYQHYLLICLLITLHIQPFSYLSIYHLPMCLPIYWLHFYLFIHPYLMYLSIYSSISPFIHPSVYLFVHTSKCLSIHPLSFFYQCLYVYLLHFILLLELHA